MPVHSLHVFDRKGKTLFTKRFITDENVQDELLAEQRKLVFGMLFSLREITASLSPSTAVDKSLHSVQTGASTLYAYESASGLRFALYMVGDTSAHATVIRNALVAVYKELWIDCVTRSPLYIPTSPNVASTNFESKLTHYLATFPWFR